VFADAHRRERWENARSSAAEERNSHRSVRMSRVATISSGFGKV
jgi:hypothetical protein